MVEEFEEILFEKCDEKSKKSRETGNETYRSKRWMETLLNYNESIAFAKSKEMLALGYANRSSVYFEIKRYDECLQNIQLARENNYPQAKMSKLNAREENCKKLIGERTETDKKNENLWDYFKLSYEPNNKIPFIVNCVEMRYTDKYGRGIYATQDLKAGDIISIEEHSASTSYIHHIYDSCVNCSKSCYLNLIPCDVTPCFMFCSATCKTQFYEKKHKHVECLSNVQMRIIHELIDAFGGRKEAEKAIMDIAKTKGTKKTIFDFDFSDQNDPNYKKNMMTCLFSLYSQRDTEFMHSECLRQLISPKPLDYILRVMISNSHFLFIAPFASLLNHSCHNNAFSYVADDKVITYIARPVKKGQQLFSTYIPYFKLDDKTFKKDLMMEYDFKCNCKICIHKVNLEETFDFEAVIYMRTNSYDKVKEYYEKCCRLINNTEMISYQKLFRLKLSCTILFSFLACLSTIGIPF